MALSGGTTNISNLQIGELNSNNTAFGGLDLRTFRAPLSYATATSASGMTTGQFRLVFQASGISLMYSSGKTQYTVGESATSLAQS